MLKLNPLLKIIIVFFISIYSSVGQDYNSFDVARKGTLEQINILYKKDKNVINAIDEQGSSMLILACYRGNTAVANFLINSGADINYVSKNGTALMACVVKGENKLVELLVQKGADVNSTDYNGMTALMMAVYFNNDEMVRLLLNAKADKELRCKQNKTAFEYAVFSNNEKIINLLK